MEFIPTPGRMVHYVTRFRDHRPAIIVEVNPDGTLSLQVFTNGHNEPSGAFRNGSLPGAGLAYVESASRSSEEDSIDVPYTWHVPERS